jgi:hypothetical protein
MTRKQWENISICIILSETEKEIGRYRVFLETVHSRVLCLVQQENDKRTGYKIFPKDPFIHYRIKNTSAKNPNRFHCRPERWRENTIPLKCWKVVLLMSHTTIWCNLMLDSHDRFLTESNKSAMHPRKQHCADGIHTIQYRHSDTSIHENLGYEKAVILD